MRVGILGVPGSGKTKLANALGKEFGLPVVDNYVQRLQKATNLALGPWASYGENYMIAGIRAAEEAKKPDEHITVGTIVDTLVYSAFKSDVVMQQDGVHRQAAYNSAAGAMTGLGIWYGEAWDYHICFYLPLNEEQKASLERWEVVLDTAYQPVLESFGATYVYGLQGEHSDRLKIAKEIIESVKQDSEGEEVPEAAETDEL